MKPIRKVVCAIIILASQSTWSWTPLSGYALDEGVSTGLSVICEMHGVAPSDKEGYWNKVYQSNPVNLVFNPKAVYMQATHGEVLLQRSGATVSTLDDSAIWGDVYGIDWTAYFGSEYLRYTAAFEVTDMSGLIYQQLGEAEASPKGFLDNCRLKKVEGLPLLSKDE